jgi:hypothetical protein
MSLKMTIGLLPLIWQLFVLTLREVSVIFYPYTCRICAFAPQVSVTGRFMSFSNKVLHRLLGRCSIAFPSWWIIESPSDLSVTVVSSTSKRQIRLSPLPARESRSAWFFVNGNPSNTKPFVAQSDLGASALIASDENVVGYFVMVLLFLTH